MEGNVEPKDTKIEDTAPRFEAQFQNLSRQEQQILAECRSEAYWFRSLPLSLALGSAAFYAVRQRIFSSSQKFGPWPKTLLGATVGYIVGKLSYARECQEKFVLSVWR